MLDEEALLAAMLREWGEGDDEYLGRLEKELLRTNLNRNTVCGLTKENA